MEVIQINDSKLKVMLSQSDLHAYAVTAEELEEDSEQAKEAFWKILAKAKEQSAFETEKERLFVQIYPARDGGCEMYIVKLPSFQTAEKRGSPLKQSLKTGYNVYRLPDMNALLTLCAKLCAVGYTDASTAYADTDTPTCYLVLWDTVLGQGTTLSTAYPMVTEYAQRQNGNAFLWYVKEHCRCLCKKNAVHTLGALCVKEG